MNISILAREEQAHTQKNHTQKGKIPSTTRDPTQTEERAKLEHPDKEIQDTTPLNPIEFLP